MYAIRSYYVKATSKRPCLAVSADGPFGINPKELPFGECLARLFEGIFARPLGDGDRTPEFPEPVHPSPVVNVTFHNKADTPAEGKLHQNPVDPADMRNNFV